MSDPTTTPGAGPSTAAERPAFGPEAQQPALQKQFQELYLEFKQMEHQILPAAQLQATAARLSEMATRLAAPVPQIKIPALPLPTPWDGTGDFKKKFVTPMTTWCSYHHFIDNQQCIPFALRQLPSTYQQLYQSYVENHPAPANFVDLCKLIKSWYPMPDPKLRYMDQIYTIQQHTGDLLEYNEEFGWLAVEMKDVLSPWFLKWRFVKGLTRLLQADLSGKYDLDDDNETLQHLMTLAVDAEGRRKALPKTNNSYTPHFIYHSSPSTSTSHQASSSSNASNHNGPTPMEINVASTFHGTCHSCGKYGHKMAECPSKRKQHNNPKFHKPKPLPKK
jgi:hypothetical protein